MYAYMYKHTHTHTHLDNVLQQHILLNIVAPRHQRHRTCLPCRHSEQPRVEPQVARRHLCVCVCVCVCMFVYMYAYMHICLYVCTYICIHIYKHTHTHTYSRYTFTHPLQDERLSGTPAAQRQKPLRTPLHKHRPHQRRPKLRRPLSHIPLPLTGRQHHALLRLCHHPPQAQEFAARGPAPPQRALSEDDLGLALVPCLQDKSVPHVERLAHLAAPELPAKDARDVGEASALQGVRAARGDAAAQNLAAAVQG